MKLYDHRLIQRGAVQSYEGHVNSHTRIQLGVDPSERFVFSGGYHFIAWKLHLTTDVRSLSLFLTFFTQVGRTEVFGFGASSPVNCCLRMNFLILSPQLCVGSKLKVLPMAHF